MFRFFRKIRRQLLWEHKLSRYLAYAIGEIILVVLGILIALQINTWNEERIDRKLERDIQKNINREFLANKLELQRIRAMNKTGLKFNTIQMSLFGKEHEELSALDTDSLIFFSTEFDPFYPSENSIYDLIQSGRLQLLQNDGLKDLLFQWAQLLKRVEEKFEGVDEKMQRDIIPYLTENYSFRDIDSYGPLGWAQKSVLPVNKTAIYEDIRYENLIDDFMYRLMAYDTELAQMEVVLDAIVHETGKVD